MNKLITNFILLGSMLVMPFAAFAQTVDLELESDTRIEADDDSAQASTEGSASAELNSDASNEDSDDDGRTDTNESSNTDANDADDSNTGRRDPNTGNGDNTRERDRAVNMRADFQSQIRERVETFQEAHANFRAEISANIQGSSELREAHMKRLRERLAQFRDQQKAEVTARIATNFNEINARITAKWADILENLRSILLRIEAKANDLGEDISSELEAAEQAIADAEAAVEVQAAKSYELEVESEETVGSAVAELRAEMATDLQVTKEAILNARAALRAAITLLR